MTDGTSTEWDSAEQARLLTEEARVARVEAKEAVDRIQQRIERLVFLSKPVDSPEDDEDGRPPHASERELAPPSCKSG